MEPCVVVVQLLSSETRIFQHIRECGRLWNRRGQVFLLLAILREWSGWLREKVRNLIKFYCKICLFYALKLNLQMRKYYLIIGFKGLQRVLLSEIIKFIKTKKISTIQNLQNLSMLLLEISSRDLCVIPQPQGLGIDNPLRIPDVLKSKCHYIKNFFDKESTKLTS